MTGHASWPPTDVTDKRIVGMVKMKKIAVSDNPMRTSLIVNYGLCYLKYI